MPIISVHLGQAGVQLGDVTWQQYAVEHGLDDSGYLTQTDRPTYKSHSTLTLSSQTSLSSLCRRLKDTGDTLESSGRVSDGFNCFFQELPEGKFCPRAVFADLEPTVIDTVRTGPMRKIYCPRLMVSGKEDAANNFARGRITASNPIHKEVAEQVRKMTETVDRLHGFLVFHSIGGGTGSGYHARLLSDIKADHPRSTVLEVSIQPSPRLSTAVVEPYNAILNTNATLDLTDCVFVCDNEAMYSICQNRLGIDNPNYSNLNRLLASTVSSITASLRFKGSLNADYQDFQTNLVPYPRIQFTVMSIAPIVSKKKAAHESLSVSDLSLQVFDPRHRLSTCQNETGRYMACCLLYRGDVTPKDVNTAIAQIKTKASVQFVNWCPTGVKVGLNTKAPERLPEGDMEACGKSVCMAANTTAVQKFWETLNCKYDVMFRKRAFIHWYTGEGMEEGEFLEAQSNILALENDYNELV